MYIYSACGKKHDKKDTHLYDDVHQIFCSLATVCNMVKYMRLGYILDLITKITLSGNTKIR